ncbi:MAG: peptide chain release factor N(5)-glutamine methyltransferase [Chloroflexota bacterium]
MRLGEALVIGQQYAERSAVRHILASELKVSSSQLLGHPETSIDNTTWARILAKLKRAQNGEPLPYLTGIAHFYQDEFLVSRDTLIPRPETELLVEAALHFINRRKAAQRVIDIGTGSGCIAISLDLYAQPIVHTFATDISFPALAIATANARRLNSSVSFCQADLLTPFSERVEFDLIVANLPYIAASETNLMDQHVLDYEPREALFSPEDGLFHIRTLLEQSGPLLAKDGMILLEFGFRQGRALLEIASYLYPNHQIKIIRDWGGHDRILQIELK